MTVKLVGSDDTTHDGDVGAEAFVLFKFTAEKSGNVTEIKLRADANGNAKVAIYADSAGAPGSRLGYNNTSQAIALGFNTLTIPSTAVVSGTDYWLAFISDLAVVGYDLITSVGKWRLETYATFNFPDPAGAFPNSPTTWHTIIAGWGTPTVVKANYAIIMG